MFEKPVQGRLKKIIYYYNMLHWINFIIDGNSLPM